METIGQQVLPVHQEDGPRRRIGPFKADRYRALLKRLGGLKGGCPKALGRVPSVPVVL